MITTALVLVVTFAAGFWCGRRSGLATGARAVRFLLDHLPEVPLGASRAEPEEATPAIH